MIRTAVAGSNSSLSNYLKIIRNAPDFLITGVVCPDFPADYQQSDFPLILGKKSFDELIDISEALVITDNAGFYFDAVLKFLKKSRHVLIMPDSSLSIYKVRKITKIAEEAGVVVHFHQNKMDQGVKEKISTFISMPEYISVSCLLNSDDHKRDHEVYEILIRELSLIFDLNPYNLRKISVSSVPFSAANPEFISLRIEFENGVSATLTISFFAKAESRILEIYSNKKMLSYDFNIQLITMIDKETSSLSIIKPEEIRSISRNEDVFDNFYKNIRKEMMYGNRFTSGIAAHQVAAAVFEQIIPCPVAG